MSDQTRQDEEAAATVEQAVELYASSKHAVVT